MRLALFLILGCLALVVLLVFTPPWKGDCRWNTESFFEKARATKITRCIEAGKDLNAPDEDGWTLLHSATMYSEDPAIIKYILKFCNLA